MVLVFLLQKAILGTMKFNDFDEIYDDIDDEQVTSDIKRRNRQLTVDLWATGWGQMLRNETSNDPQG